MRKSYIQMFPCIASSVTYDQLSSHTFVALGKLFSDDVVNVVIVALLSPPAGGDWFTTTDLRRRVAKK